MEEIIRILHGKGCSLVVRSVAGEVSDYAQPGVRDLIWLMDHEPERLRGASIADKVIGKAAAGLAVRAGVVRIYAEVLSRAAVPLLDEAGIDYSFGQLVDRIVIPEGDDRCPLEQIVAPAEDAAQVETLLRLHFEEMRRQSQT